MANQTKKQKENAFRAFLVTNTCVRNIRTMEIAARTSSWKNGWRGRDVGCVLMVFSVDHPLSLIRTDALT